MFLTTNGKCCRNLARYKIKDMKTNYYEIKKKFILECVSVIYTNYMKIMYINKVCMKWKSFFPGNNGTFSRPCEFRCQSKTVTTRHIAYVQDHPPVNGTCSG